MRLEDYAIVLNDKSAKAVERSANVLHAVLSQQLGDRCEADVPRFQWAARPGVHDGRQWWLRVRPDLVDTAKIKTGLHGSLIRPVSVPHTGETVFYSVDYCADAPAHAIGALGLIRETVETKAREILGKAFDLDAPGAFCCINGLESRTHPITGRSKPRTRYYMSVSGTAQVRDAGELDYFLHRGIGRGRGYGFGLLMIEPT